MRRCLYMLVLALCLLPARLSGGELLAYRDSLKDGYNFLLYLPDCYGEKMEEPLPVIVYLHGKSRVGNDLNMVTTYGCIDALRRGARIDAVIICPQCTTTAGWKAERVMKVVDYVYERYNCDPDRLYVYGMSMGGWGAFKMIAEYPDRFAAAIAMCGGYVGNQIKNIGEVPLWIIHGTGDDATNLTYSTGVVQRLVDSGSADRVRFTWLADQGHSILARVFLLEDTYKWLFQHRLSAPGRRCSRDYDVTIADLRKAYIMLGEDNRQKLPIVWKP